MHGNVVVILFILAFFVVPQILKAMRGGVSVRRTSIVAGDDDADDDDDEEDEDEEPGAGRTIGPGFIREALQEAVLETSAVSRERPPAARPVPTRTAVPPAVRSAAAQRANPFGDAAGVVFGLRPVVDARAPLAPSKPLQARAARNVTHPLDPLPPL